jgi:hypothetical protein
VLGHFSAGLFTQTWDLRFAVHKQHQGGLTTRLQAFSSMTGGTYGTLLLMDHYSPAKVQMQKYHSISPTIDIYRHWIPEKGKQKARSLTTPVPQIGMKASPFH